MAALLQFAFGIVLLPFLLLSFGDRTTNFGGQVTHLSQPSCWLAVMPCSVADMTLFALPNHSSVPAETSSSASHSIDAEPFMPLPSSFTVRHFWFALWLLWFVLFLVRRERLRREA